MKVIHIIGDLAQGGAESQLERIISYSSALQCQHIVISLKNNETPLHNRLIAAGIEVISPRFSGANIFFALVRLRILLKEHVTSTSVIQCWMYHANLFGALAAGSLGMSDKVVWNIRRTLLPSGALGIISKLSAKLSHYLPVHIVCCAQAAKNSHVATGYNEKKMTVIHNGIDTELFTPNNNNHNAFRESIGINNNTLVIGMVGRYAKVKGHVYLLKALLMLQASNTDLFQNIKLVLVGRGISEDEELQGLLTKLKDNVVVIQERPDIYSIMPGFDFLCMPSESEGFPNVVAEAMACGVPALVTDVGDAALIVDNKQWVVQPCDVEALSNGIAYMATSLDSMPSNFPVNIRNKIVNRFSVQVAWANYLKIYNKIIKSN
jgi:glycosyltransferase involved in cell wall biosynthesis